MRKVWFWSFVAGTFAMLGSVLIINTLMPLMGQEIVSSMYWASVIGSYGIGSPVTYYCLRQNHRLNQALHYLADAEVKLRQANAELANANAQLEMKTAVATAGAEPPVEGAHALVNGTVVR
ncbi:MAG: hypothetical protein AAGG69_01200 [Pseudomonadota bacterium]